MEASGRVAPGGVAVVLGLMVAAAAAGCLGDEDPTTPTENGPNDADGTDGAVGANDGNGSGSSAGVPPNATAPPGGPGDDAPGSAPLVPTTVAQRACRQYHVFYPVAWSSVAGGMPEGFGPDGMDPTGQTTTLYQHLPACVLEDPAVGPGTNASVDMAELWTAVAVTPPAELANQGAVLHLVPMSLVVDAAPLAAIYNAWGFADVVRTGTIAWTETATPAARSGMAEIATETATYGLHAQVGPPTAGDLPGTDRLFAVSNGTVTGWFDYAWPGWTDIGTGTVVFTSQGDPDAPPGFGGNVHQVEDTDVTLTYTAHTPNPA